MRMSLARVSVNQALPMAGLLHLLIAMGILSTPAALRSVC